MDLVIYIPFDYSRIVSKANCLTYPKAIPLVAAMNISSLSLKPFSVSKHTEKYSELETWEKQKKNIEIKLKALFRY